MRSTTTMKSSPRNSMQRFSSKQLRIQNFAIAVTATPINTNMDELNYILNNICSEESEHRFTQLSEDRNERWFDSLRKIKHWARTSEDSLSTCPIGMIDELIECVEEGLTPTQWEMLSEDDKANVVEWLRIQLTDDSCLTPSLALTWSGNFTHMVGTLA